VEQLPADYPQFLAEVKARIAAARTRAMLAVNTELIQLYWEIGHDILGREQREGWGARIIDRLAVDLRRDFPEMKGLSRSNLYYMRQLATAWPDDEVVPQPVGQLPWGHALPESDSELVRDAIKDPYNFEFLGLSGRAKERGARACSAQ
jgi:predicted nuclease of restriction endonuclease-like (RecB) superfamily